MNSKYTLALLATLVLFGCNLSDDAATTTNNANNTENNANNTANNSNNANNTTNNANNTANNSNNANNTVTCDENSCTGNATCSVSENQIVCTCEDGWVGVECNLCAPGYQDADANGTCEPDCSTANLACNTGSCEIIEGLPTCQCPFGYLGDECGECDVTHQDNNGDGVCEANCDLAGLECGNYGSCNDLSGQAECLCYDGWAGANCQECAPGFQDDDGNGICQVICLDSPWWDAAYANRTPLRIVNNTTQALRPGQTGQVKFNHAELTLTNRSLSNGDDVRVVYVDATGARPVPRTSLNGWGYTDTDVTFELQSELPAQATSENYWLYWNNPNAGAPRAWGPTAIDTDNGNPLTCDRKAGGFLSIQMRQVGPQTYEAFANEHTGDGNSFGRIRVADASTGAVHFDKTYKEMGGSCCSPVVDGSAADTFTVPSSTFTVELESQEYSGSVRFFGCEAYGTSYPAGAETTIKKFTIDGQRADGTHCTW